MVIGLGCLEAIGVFSVMPFLTVISDPDSINTNKYLNAFYNYLQEFGIQNHRQYIVFVGVISLVLLAFQPSINVFRFIK